MRMLAALIASLFLFIAGPASAYPDLPEIPPFQPTPLQNKDVDPVLQQLDRSSRNMLRAFQQQTASVKLEEVPPFKNAKTLKAVYESIRAIHMGDGAADKALYYGAIRGMVAALNDPYSRFLAPDEAKRMMEAMNGQMVGIGAALETRGNETLVEEVFADSPAEKAGIKAGDVFVRIDGEPAKGLPLNELIRKVRGEAGTTVKLDMRRGARTLQFVVERGVTVVPSVKWTKLDRDGKSFLHVQVRTYDNNTVRLFVQAVTQAKMLNVDGVIVDVRDDGGGQLNVAAFMVCQWLEGPKIVTTLRNKNGDEEKYVCPKFHSAPLANMPTVVLQNKASASASEITAAALQDWGKATVIGEQSFGKGVGQSVLRFDDGSMMMLVSFKWYTPRDRNINKVGVTPDIAVTPPAEGTRGDPQLERALQKLLTGK